MNLYQRGVIYGNRGQLLKAMTLVEDDDLFRYHLQADRKQMQRLTQLIKEEPGNLEYLLNLAHSFYQIGNYEQSMEILQLVLEKKPKLSFANLYMGYNLLEVGKKEEALTFFKNTAKNDPQQMGTVMREIGLLSLLKEIDNNPGDPVLQRSLAEYYNLKKEYLKSLEYSLPLLQQDQMNLKVLQIIVYSYRGLGEAKEVLMYGGRYSLIDPEEMHLQFIMAEIFVQLNKCMKALPLLEKVLKEDDTYRNAWELKEFCQKSPSA
jgi:predicted Zn-dependent protease